MSLSMRERIIQGVTARLAAALPDAQLLRSPASPVSRRLPALLLFPERDEPLETSNTLAQRSLDVRLVAVAGGRDRFTVADQLLVTAHAALYADPPNLSGLVLTLRQGECEWESDDLDDATAASPASYRFTYRHSLTDLTTG